MRQKTYRLKKLYQEKTFFWPSKKSFVFVDRIEVANPFYEIAFANLIIQKKIMEEKIAKIKFAATIKIDKKSLVAMTKEQKIKAIISIKNRDTAFKNVLTTKKAKLMIISLWELHSMVRENILRRI